MNRSYLLLALPLAIGLAACDDDDTDITDPEPTTYAAILAPLNNSGTTGAATFTIDEEGDALTAEVTVTDASGGTSTLHAQHIHFASTCPTMAADANADGYLDVVEGVPTYGAILVQLDADLSTYETQSAFPTGTSYSYTEAADFSTVLAAHQMEDTNMTDPLATLGTDGELALGTRTVVVHGIAADSTLPATVQTVAGLPAQVTLPIACGEITES